jgi:hypothetical protein
MKLILFCSLLLIVHVFAISQQTILSDSNLPILIIQTDINPQNGQPLEIVDDPKVPATMKLIYRPDGSRNYLTDVNNADYLNYDGKIMIEFRGSSSQALEKKPYGFSTKMADNTTNNNVSLLDMPAENDWVLNALAFDESMIRDMLSYDLSRNLGNYAPRGRYVEVISNGDYKGVYVLMEKIKRDGGRVNIFDMSPDDNLMPDLTGGYIVKADKTTGGDIVAWQMAGPAGNSKFLYHFPEQDEISTPQAVYIENYFNQLAIRTNPANPNPATGYPDLIDIPSFIDFMLIAEISSNVDAYQLSTYFHKDKEGKLRAGPVWDYNLTFGNDLFFWGYDRSHTDVWQFNNGDNAGAYFWLRLFNDPIYKCHLSKRWFEVTNAGGAMSYAAIVEIIDYYTALLEESSAREQQRWGTVGGRLNNVNAMKTWLQTRILWISNNIGSPSACMNPTLPNLVISKIHYNPLNQENFTSNELEFFEITNNSNETVDLTGIYIRELGISYRFPAGTSAAPNEKIILCSDPMKFTLFYGYAPFDGYYRTLSNKDDHIVLADAFGNIIDEVHYFDNAPWPSAADGNGPYLCLNDLNADNSLAQNWSACGHVSVDWYGTANLDLVVYPVPFGDQLSLFVEDNTITSITILDVQGRKIANMEYFSNSSGQVVSVNTSDLQKGVYLLSVVLDSGALITKTIVKQ